jgi:2-succinyl-6-hydroxy-2,4-cyclohexadiene-1-carboxylate synthase
MENLKPLIHFFHGFLGLPTDWKDWQSHFQLEGYETVAVNIANLIDSENETLQAVADVYSSQNLNSSNILIGYSLGGRLAWEIASRSPKKVNSLILFSTKVTSPQLKPERTKWENQWAQKWSNANWDQTVSEWQSQEIFKFDEPRVRNESDFDRGKLSKMMTHWSVADQFGFEALFEKVPTLWAMGDLDKSMNPSLEVVSRATKAQVYLEPNAGHRFPFEMRPSTLKKVSEFLANPFAKFVESPSSGL